MKLVQIILPPDKLDVVKEALAQAEVYRFTITEVLGSGAHEPAQAAEGKAQVELLRRIKIEIAMNDHFLQPTIDAVLKAGIGDSHDLGKILVLKLDDVIRIRTGEHGGEAV